MDNTGKLIDPFECIDEIPLYTYESPLTKNSFSIPTHSMMIEEAQGMERILRRNLIKCNTPGRGESKLMRKPIGDCSKQVFETYMSATMPNNLFKRTEVYPSNNNESITHITYEFTYPHFPSFGKSEWTKLYNNIQVASQMESYDSTIPQPTYAQYRTIAKKLYISMDTQSGHYYIHLTNWVQRKCASNSSKSGFVWMNSDYQSNSSFHQKP